MTAARPGAVGPATSRPRRRAGGAGIGRIAALAIVAVLLQVSVMPYVNIADGIPDIVAPTVVAAALLRGVLAGTVCGFAAGLMVELTSPVGSLGVLALMYLAVGAWCGRYCGRDESRSLAAPLVLSVAGALVVQVGYGFVHVLVGATMPVSDFVVAVVLPTLALTALLSPPVLLVARRLLGAPRVLEPFAMPA